MMGPAGRGGSSGATDEADAQRASASRSRRAGAARGLRRVLVVVGLRVVPVVRRAAERPAQAASSPSPSVPEPVLDENFPDPDVMKVGDTWYAYATQQGEPEFEPASWPRRRTWSRGSCSTTDPLPKLPAWATPGRTWAPDVSTVRAAGT